MLVLKIELAFPTTQDWTLLILQVRAYNFITALFCITEDGGSAHEKCMEKYKFFVCKFEIEVRQIYEWGSEMVKSFTGANLCWEFGLS